ncbi:hypothetical protein [Rhodococcus sp. BS-15]|uniref:hypothetical protein n=1 Tax=Rhodococcus sp. BS-15 TaxID=1304954 RepID=UPI000AD1285E|nr:hypothetical protein [Rhodococcus sp. BS-15]
MSHSTNSRTSFDGVEVTTVTVDHPDGGVAEVRVAVGEGGRLEVSIDASSTNGYVVDVDETTVAEK